MLLDLCCPCLRAPPARPARPAHSLPARCVRAVVVGQTLEKSLCLKNNSDYAVAFKVKTTAPKRYCVRPNSSVIKPHESMQVRIVMQVAFLAAGVHARHAYAPAPDTSPACYHRATEGVRTCQRSR